MPMLQNQRHELFAQKVASGMSASEAYRQAGYSQAGANRNARRFMANDVIRQRIDEIRAKAAKKTEITLADLISKAEYLYDLGAKSGQVSAAVAALRELGVLTGQRIERREAGSPGEFERLSDEQLREYIETGITAAGESDEGALDPRVTSAMRAKPN